MKKITLQIKVFILLIFFILPCVSTAVEKPEIFVQVGHTDSVKIIAINKSGTYLVTMEEGGRGTYVKIWDTAIGREIRTLKLEPKDGGASNIYFIDDSRFIVFYQKSAEIFDLHGQKTESINLPKIGFVKNPVIGKDGQYLFNRYSDDEIKIYSMKDGSQISLPELRKYKDNERYHHGVADLGFGYYGIFYMGQSPKGNVDYVIYDDSLSIRMKGSLNIPGFPFGSTFKISSDLKYVAHGTGKGVRSDDIDVYNLLTGERLLSYKPRALARGEAGHDERLYFGFIPDGRLSVVYEKQNDAKSNFTQRIELVLISPVNNGIYTEKSLLFDELPGFCSPYVITDKGMLIAGFANGNVKMTNINTGAEIKSFGVKPSVFIHSVCVGDYVLNHQLDFSRSEYIKLRFNLWDLGAAGLKKLNVTNETGRYEKPIKIGKNRSINATYPFSTDPDRLYSQIPIEFIDEDFKKGDDYGGLSFSFLHPNTTCNFSTKEEQHKLVLMNRKTSAKLADLYAFEDGEWIIIMPDGYYNASTNGDKYLSVRIGNNIYGIENYREAFFRPDIVKVALQGGSLKDLRNIADVKQPPVVSIVDTTKLANKDEVKVTLKIVDIGGGIGDVRLYLNGSAVVLDSTRGVKIVPTNKNEILKTYNLKLTNGTNTIRAVAFNAENTMQSNDVIYTITASFKSSSKPSLHALILGINEYKNPKLQLSYAVADADLFADALKKSSSGLFERINIKKLTTKDETTSERIVKELKAMKTINPDDLFVFYVASHGTVDEGEYFLITSNVGSTRTEKLQTDAISQTIMKELIANIPATKKLIVLDTCNAGAMGDAIQVAMLTRGMSEDTAMKILSRAVGSTILSASTSFQEAVEGYKGHGLFTYVITEGLNGKADKGKTGYIKTTDLADYVDNEVPVLAEKVFKKAQYPTISISGQAFPIGKVK